MAKKGTRQSAWQTSSSEYQDFEMTEDEAPLLCETPAFLAEVKHRDKKTAADIFNRYDEGGRNTIRLTDIKMILQDAGLFPISPEEKQEVHKTLVNIARGIEDDEDQSESESECNAGGESHRRNLCRDATDSVQLYAMTGGSVAEAEAKFSANSDDQSIIERTLLSQQDLPGLLARVRARLRFCRRRSRVELFNRFDIFENGELNIGTVITMLEELELLCPAEPMVVARFLHWLQFMCAEENEEAKDEDIFFDPTVPESCIPEITNAGKFAIDPVEMLPKETERRTVRFLEVEAILEYVQELGQHLAAWEQRSLARNKGVMKSRLFGEFRHEFSQLWEIHYTLADAEGLVQCNQVWLTLTKLGIVPKLHEHRVAVMKIMTAWGKASEQRREGKSSSPVDLALSLLSRDDQGHSFFDANAVHTFSFEAFLALLSRLRTWHGQSMRQELRPFFERQVRKRKGRGCTMDVPDVCRCLEELGMAPTDAQEREELGSLLEACNEWGFSKPVFNFETFVNFIRRVREWKAQKDHAHEVEHAREVLNFGEMTTCQYRAAFSIFDRGGRERLDITEVRKIFRLLGRNVSSDDLRASFHKNDISKTGLVDFIRFLHIVDEVEGKRLRRSQCPPWSVAAELVSAPGGTTLPNTQLSNGPLPNTPSSSTALASPQNVPGEVEKMASRQAAQRLSGPSVPESPSRRQASNIGPESPSRRVTPSRSPSRSFH